MRKMAEQAVMGGSPAHTREIILLGHDLIIDLVVCRLRDDLLPCHMRGCCAIQITKSQAFRIPMTSNRIVARPTVTRPNVVRNHIPMAPPG
jgi:hypothetical protein